MLAFAHHPRYNPSRFVAEEPSEVFPPLKGQPMTADSSFLNESSGDLARAHETDFHSQSRGGASDFSLVPLSDVSLKVATAPGSHAGGAPRRINHTIPTNRDFGPTKWRGLSWASLGNYTWILLGLSVAYFLGIMQPVYVVEISASKIVCQTLSHLRSSTGLLPIPERCRSIDQHLSFGCSCTPLQPESPSIGGRDFALRADGAKFIPGLTTNNFLEKSSEADIQRRIPDLAPTGENHRSFPGGEGQLGIVLVEPILIAQVTINRTQFSPAPSLECLPRDFILWGLIDGDDNVLKSRQNSTLVHRLFSRLPPTFSFPSSSVTESFSPLVYSRYDPRNGLAQSFSIFDEVVLLELDFGVVVLQILNNWGGSSTCLHRVEVRGRLRTED
ncbi:hypothetical protein SCP_1900890 [Sparassis crispa]|uniref:SUN domain-containing protein n=1 Tax=Sparassis crispa TaxID=139825 RepID=A0A401H7C8_9APHY|nr:hypothetical protein SCP_1900890 [Sparassis crispa]GBE90240.1 hypothetical protein SCP_1900890 [Sparassis crispa]